MKHKLNKSEQDFNLEEENGIDQPTKVQIQKTCERLNLPFTKETAMAIIYGDNQMLPERIPPTWLNGLQ
jgi:hypothetical protein